MSEWNDPNLEIFLEKFINVFWLRNSWTLIRSPKTRLNFLKASAVGTVDEVDGDIMCLCSHLFRSLHILNWVSLCIKEFLFLFLVLTLCVFLCLSLSLFLHFCPRFGSAHFLFIFALVPQTSVFLSLHFSYALHYIYNNLFLHLILYTHRIVSSYYTCAHFPCFAPCGGFALPLAPPLSAPPSCEGLLLQDNAVSAEIRALLSSYYSDRWSNQGDCFRPLTSFPASADPFCMVSWPGFVKTFSAFLNFVLNRRCTCREILKTARHRMLAIVVKWYWI